MTMAEPLAEASVQVMQVQSWRAQIVNDMKIGQFIDTVDAIHDPLVEQYKQLLKVIKAARTVV